MSTVPAASDRHVPVRTCVGCRQSRPQPTLLRLARTREGVQYDPAGWYGGRGAYLCPDVRCVQAAARRDAAALRRALPGITVDEARTAIHEVRAVATGDEDSRRRGTPRRRVTGPAKKVRAAP